MKPRMTPHSLPSWVSYGASAMRSLKYDHSEIWIFRCDVETHEHVITIPHCILSDSLEAAPQIYLNAQSTNGVLQNGIDSFHTCQGLCQATSDCRAIDYDFNTQACLFHTTHTSCNELSGQPASIHVKEETCSGEGMGKWWGCNIMFTVDIHVYIWPIDVIYRNLGQNLFGW